MESTSVSLLRRVQSTEHEVAWERFVDLYAPLIYHWGRNHGLDETDTADLVQDVLEILVRKLPEFQYDPTRRFRGWLRTITLNRASDFHRKARNRPTSTSGQEETIQSAVATETDLLAEDEYRKFVVNRALKMMKDEFREDHWMAVWQYVIEGRKADEVAQNLGISVNMVYLAKSRILGRLREELDGLLD